MEKTMTSEVLVIMDSDGHFQCIILEDEEKKLSVLRDFVMQITKELRQYSDEVRGNAYRLAHEGTVEEIIDFLDDEADLRFGRSGGGRIDIIKAHEDLPKSFLSDLII